MSWSHWPWKPLVLPAHLPPGEELTQMGQHKEAAKMAEVECPSSSPDGRSIRKSVATRQQSTNYRAEAYALLAAAQTLNQERDFLLTQCFWLTVGPSCRVFNHKKGTRSSATSGRRCPCLRTKHLWPSSGSLLPVELEAMRKQTGCQKWKASWSNLHTPCPTSKQRSS